MLESVAIRRKLAEERPQAFLADLAMSLVNLSVFQNELGRREESLATVKEAAERYRKLAQAYSAAYLPALAICLSNLAAVQSALGRNSEALASVQEAVEYYRRLAKMMPAVFLPQLAASLNTLGSVQSGLEQWQRGPGLRARGRGDPPQARRGATQGGPPRAGAELEQPGRAAERTGPGEEALGRARRGRGHPPPAGRGAPAGLPLGAGHQLEQPGHPAGHAGPGRAALASVHEAVGIRRLLADEHPEAFRPELAVSVATLSQVQKWPGPGSRGGGLAARGARHHLALLPEAAHRLHRLTGTILQELTALQGQVGGAASRLLEGAPGDLDADAGEGSGADALSRGARPPGGRDTEPFRFEKPILNMS